MKNAPALLFLFTLGIVSAGFGATGLSFLEIPVGARESALGGAATALITGPTAVAHNPAAAAFLPRSVALSHTRHFADTRVLFASANIRRGALALAPHYWGTRTSDIEYRERATRQPISTFDATNAALGGTIAFHYGKFALGATGRYLHQKIHIESADGWAVDAGILARNLVPGLAAALALQHLGHVNTMVAESPRLPTTLRAGFAYEHPVSGFGQLLLAAEAHAVRDNTPLFKAGLEYRAPGYVALRAGYVAGLEAQDFSLGLGLFIKSYRFDYAFIPYRENLGDGHRFTFSFDL